MKLSGITKKSRHCCDNCRGDSLQKVTIDRILKLVEAANLVASVRVKQAA